MSIYYKHQISSQIMKVKAMKNILFFLKEETGNKNEKKKLKYKTDVHEIGNMIRQAER